MGNLLGSPITEKETHVGETNGDGTTNTLKYGLSTMQGWRVHMEDAHIAETEVYALQHNNQVTKKIVLKGHSIFAVFDGHGGTFAAIYSGNNFLRILSKQQNFMNYAKLCELEDQETTNTVGEEQANKKSKNNNNDEDNATTTTTSSTSSTIKNREQKKLEHLEKAFQQAFVETDYEIALAVRGKQHVDANTLYHPATSSTSSLNFSTAAIAKAAAAVGDAAAANTTQHHRTNSAASSAVAVGVAAQAFSDQKSALEDEGDSGTTACVVMITPTSIICANAGDSRAVFARRTITPNTTTTEEAKSPCVRHQSDESTSPSNIQQEHSITHDNNKAIALSYDHKPEDDSEERRIRAAGGYVANGRVEGDLAVSRGLGDFRFKQMAIVLNNTQLYPDTHKNSNNNSNTDQHMATDDEGGEESEEDDTNNQNNTNHQILLQPGTQKVSPIPDFICHTRQHQHDEYVLVACDGIWDVVNNQQCIHDIDTIMYVEGEKDVGLIAEEILDSCLLYGSKDNMTAILIQLPACEKSYALAKAAINSSTTTGTNQQQQQQEGVVGRRRIRNNLQHQNSNEHQNHNHTTTNAISENQQDHTQNQNQNENNAMENSNIHQNQYDEHKYT